MARASERHSRFSLVVFSVDHRQLAARKLITRSCIHEQGKPKDLIDNLEPLLALSDLHTSQERQPRNKPILKQSKRTRSPSYIRAIALSDSTVLRVLAFRSPLLLLTIPVLGVLLQACTASDDKGKADITPKSSLIAIRCTLAGQEEQSSSYEIGGDKSTPKNSTISFIIDSSNKKAYGEGGLDTEPLPARFYQDRIVIGEDSDKESVASRSRSTSSWLYIINRKTLQAEHTYHSSLQSDTGIALTSGKLEGTCSKISMPKPKPEKPNAI